MADIVASSQIPMGQSCMPHSFTFPEVFGAKFTNLEANLVTNYSIPFDLLQLNPPHPDTKTQNLVFCNVSLEYTHPGYNDNINTQVWLPVEDWNGRLQGSGGGGFQAGLIPPNLAQAVDEGYACVSTDGGHVLDGIDVSSWALTSPGNVNWALLQTFMSTALNESAAIGKSITREFYGQAPRKSYFRGCSMGGRQGLQLAQRYPDAYDGILAMAPAIHLPKFIVAEYWPQMIMHEAGEYPPPCELDAITSAAVHACDELDGVKDGIISAPELCHFDAKTLIGNTIDCATTGGRIKISELAVEVAETAWAGAHGPDSTLLWPGLNHEAPLTGPIGLGNTRCDETGCHPAPFPIPESWIKWFLKKDPDWDLPTLRHEEATRLFYQAHQWYQSIASADDPDLSAFRNAGGKMITWHGLADEVIMPNGTKNYYEAVARHDPAVRDYYRYFEAPGVGHCHYGAGPFPEAAFRQLVEWVERGIAPDTLPARSLPDAEGRRFERELCAYPGRATYKGTGDIRAPESFECL